ncbi:MAG TPA: Abi-alpha family protein [Puia sp.]|jgi:hypothetical protein
MDDPLGIKPLGEAVNTIVKKTFEGIEAFLQATCKPALDELGQMLRDHVRVWRLNNALKIVNKAKEKFEIQAGEIQLKANPKVALAIIENGSNEESDELQELWAGLFTTSYSLDGKDEENLLYVSILKQLTLPEAKLVSYMCNQSKKNLSDTGIVRSQTLSIYGDTIAEITDISDFNKQEIILYHLSSLRLIDKPDSTNPGGFKSLNFNGKPLAWLTPTNLALNFYIRCNGFTGTVKQYWKL